MVRRAYRQRSLVEVLLPDADKLWDPTLRRIDTLLDDEALVDRVADALAQRHPESQRRGRLGTPADVVLRMLVLKHLHDWSFDECEREVRGSLVYRAFCRIDGERVPDAKTLIRLAQLLDEPVLKDLLAQLVLRGRERRVIHGRRLRVDPTVVETNIHYPTDATLLADGVRVLTRTLRRLGAQVRTRTRSVARRVYEIAQRSRTAGPQTSPKVRAQSKARMKVLFRERRGRAISPQRRGQAERALWAPALDRHIALFNHAPQLAVADGGFASRSNERAAQDRGVRHVVLPRQPRETRSRAARAALRWRTGSEGRISALKRRHGLRRCRYRGASGMQRWVGLGVLANDLLVLARAGP
jgi:IS5 family transposase